MLEDSSAGYQKKNKKKQRNATTKDSGKVSRFS